MSIAFQQLAAAACEKSFLGIPPWYEGLTGSAPECNIEFNSLNDTWTVALNILEILLRLSAIVAVGFIIFGSIMMIMSQGNPDRVGQARGTILNAVIGFVLAVAAASIVSLIAGSLG